MQRTEKKGNAHRRLWGVWPHSDGKAKHSAPWAYYDGDLSNEDFKRVSKKLLRGEDRRAIEEGLSDEEEATEEEMESVHKPEVYVQLASTVRTEAGSRRKHRAHEEESL